MFFIWLCVYWWAPTKENDCRGCLPQGPFLVRLQALWLLWHPGAVAILLWASEPRFATAFMSVLRRGDVVILDSHLTLSRTLSLCLSSVPAYRLIVPRHGSCRCLRSIGWRPLGDGPRSSYGEALLTAPGCSLGTVHVWYLAHTKRPSYGELKALAWLWKETCGTLLLGNNLGQRGQSGRGASHADKAVPSPVWRSGCGHSKPCNSVLSQGWFDSALLGSHSTFLISIYGFITSFPEKHQPRG